MDPKRAQALAKTKQLIALSASSIEEEARTAALTACKLIREHGFELTFGSSDVEEGSTSGTYANGDDGIKSARETVNSFFDMLEKLSGPEARPSSKTRGGGR